VRTEGVKMRRDALRRENGPAENRQFRLAADRPPIGYRG
jgi:hypothetical protein